MNEKVIVSLTSYPYRFKKPGMMDCLKSLVEQDTKIPYKIVFNLFKDDIKYLPSGLMSYIEENNIEIYSCPLDIRSHKKYFYVMQKYKDLPIITVDDDIIYSKHLVSDLYSSYVKYSKCVSACYLYRMAFDGNDKVIPSFKRWDVKYDKYEPSFRNAFGSGGGTLFPPGCLEMSGERLTMIRKFITDDELLLKKWLNDAGYPVIKCKYDWDDEEHGKKSKCGSYLEATDYATDDNSLWRSENRTSMDSHIKSLLCDYDYKKLDDSLKSSIIITMTSWKKRIDEVIKTIKSCNDQTVVPDRIYLNLSVEEFPGKRKDIPFEIVEYEKNHNNFMINWVEGPNTKPFKKMFPILKYCRLNDIIITVDDDIILPNDFVESRVLDFQQFGMPITSATSYDKTLFCKKINAGSLFVKKMLWNWDKFVNDRVIETHNDDRTYLYILYMNGYKPRTCTKYNISAITKEMANKNETNKLSSTVKFKFGKHYDEYVNDVVVDLTGKPITKSFGYFNDGNAQEKVTVPLARTIKRTVKQTPAPTPNKTTLAQLRSDIQAGRVIKVPVNGGFIWKRIK